MQDAVMATCRVHLSKQRQVLFSFSEDCPTQAMLDAIGSAFNPNMQGLQFSTVLPLDV